jgi:crossover junction endodeoxyribonuclease RuvC
VIVGVDPGVVGGVAFLPADGRNPILYDMPAAGREVDCANLGELIRRHMPDYAVVERVASRPAQGIASAFKFGRATGCVLGVLGALRVPIQQVTPTTWKRALNLNSDKELSRKRALEIWPEVSADLALKKHADRAEAALLAYWLFHHLD